MNDQPRICKLCGGEIGQDRWNNGLMCFGCGPVDALPLEEYRKLSMVELYRREHGSEPTLIRLLKRSP